MKAETILEKQFGAELCNLEESLVEAMKIYAKDQIEKDRERVKKSYYDETDSSDFNSMINDTPIILD